MDAKQTKNAVEIELELSANWTRIEELTPGTLANRLALGQCFRDLRGLYSDRDSGGRRLTSGHGVFEKECIQRGYRPRTVRGWIADYEAALSGGPTEAQKRAVRTKAKAQTQKAPAPVAIDQARPTPHSTAEQSADAATNLFRGTLDYAFRVVSWLQDPEKIDAIPCSVQQDHDAEHVLGSLMEMKKKINKTIALVDAARSGSLSEPSQAKWTTPEITEITPEVTSTAVH